MVGCAHTEMTVMKEAAYAQSWKQEGRAPCVGLLGETPGWVRRERELGENGGRELTDGLQLPLEGRGKAELAGPELTRLSNFRGLWGIEAVLSCLARGSGVPRASE